MSSPIEVASLIVSAEGRTGDAEKALDRLGIKWDQTVSRMRGAEGRFVGMTDAQRRAAAEAQRHATAVDGLRNKLQGLSATATQVGVALTAGVTLPILGALAAIVSIGTKTATSLNVLQATSRATAAQMDKARSVARALGADLSLPGTSAADAALAMVELSKGGLTLEQSMNAARGTIQLARAATIGEAQAAVIAADALNTFKLAGDQAGRVADLLAGAANASSGEISDMALALAQVGAVAKGAGLSIEDTATAISLMARNGVKASDAGTSIKTFLLALQSPISNEASATMRALAIDAYDLDRNFKPLPTLIGEFKSKLSGLNQEAQSKALREIFGQDAIRAARILFGEGTAGFEAMKRAITVQGAAADIASAKARGLAGAWEGLKSTLETFAGDVFGDLEAPLTKMVQGIANGVQSLADAWNNMGAPAKAAIATLVGLAAAAGPVLVVVGTIASAVLGMAGSIATISLAGGTIAGLAAILVPVGAVILGIIGLIAEWAIIAATTAAVIYKAWSVNFLGIRDLTQQAWGAIKSFTLSVWVELKDAYNQVMPQLLELTRTVLGAIQAFWDVHGARIVALVKAAWAIITTTVRAAIKVVSTVVTGVLAVINGDWQTAWNMAVKIVDGFLKGVDTLLDLAVAAINRLVVWLIGKAVNFNKAGLEWGKKLVDGFVAEILNGLPRITAAVGQVIAVLTNPAILAAMVASGVAHARAYNSGFASSVGAAAGIGPPPEAGAGISVGKSVVPQKVKLPGLPGGPGGGGGGGGGGGERAAARRFKLEAEILDVGIQAIERLNQKALTDAEYFYTEGNLLLEDYVTARRTAVAKLFAAETLRNNQEVAALQASGLVGRARVLAEAEIAEKVAATSQKHGVAMAEIDRLSAAERLTTQKTSWQQGTDLLQEVANGQQSVYQQMADAGVISFRTAQSAINAAQAELLQRQKRGQEIQRDGMDAAGVNKQSQPYKDLAHQIQLTLQQIENTRAEHSLKLQRSTQQDADTLRSHVAQITSINATIAGLDLQNQRDQLRILEQMGLSKERVWQREMEISQEAAAADTARRIADLVSQRDYVQQFEQNEQRKADIVGAINGQIAAEERRGSQERENIAADFYEKQRTKLREWADRIVGTFKTALDRSKEEGFKGFFKSLGNSFREMLEQWAMDLAKSRVLGLLSTVFKVPQITASGAGGGPTPPGGGGVQEILGGLDLWKIINPGGDNSALAISKAGQAATGAIKDGWQDSTGKIGEVGDAQGKTLTTVGQSIVGSMLQIASVIAQGSTGGGFWKGLLLAAGTAAIGTLVGRIGLPGGGGALSGTVNPAPGNAAAMGGFFGSKGGGHYIQVAEGGFDELVLTTDPSQRSRMARLMGAYIRMTGINASFANGGFTSGYQAPTYTSGADRTTKLVTVQLTQEIHTNNPEAFQRSARQNARAARGALFQVMN